MEKTTSAFLDRLREIQSELKAPKDLNNTFGGYKYRSNESILEALKPLLAKHEMVLTQSDELVLIGDRYYIKATSTIEDINGNGSKSVSAFAREDESKKGMDSAQVTGSTSSYARKYSLNGAFSIDDTKDADTDEHRDQTTPKTSSKPAVQTSSNTATRATTAPARTSPAPQPIKAECEIPGCENVVNDRERSKQANDGHAICWNHSNDKTVPWKSLHPAYQDSSVLTPEEEDQLADDALAALGGTEVPNHTTAPDGTVEETL